MLTPALLSPFSSSTVSRRCKYTTAIVGLKPFIYLSIIIYLSRFYLCVFVKDNTIHQYDYNYTCFSHPAPIYYGIWVSILMWLQEGDKAGYAFAPFGKGRHMCIGERLGLTQVSLFIWMTLRQFHWKIDGISDLESVQVSHKLREQAC